MFRKSTILDELNRALLISGLICALLGSLLFRTGAARWIFSGLATALLVCAILRLFGGNRPDRRANENRVFLTAVTAVSDFFRRLFSNAGGQPRARRAHKARKNPAWSEIKQYKYFICPQCAQRLRVPRGKGRLRVTCTRCGNVFETKS